MSVKNLKKLPIITIITPSRNQGEFIKNTIDSVLSQDYPALEYQVRDCTSTDQTLQVLRSYGTRLSWISEPDKGQSDAINKGWRETQGEILAWLNSDDCLYPEALRKVGNFFRDNPEVDVLYGDCELINQSGSFLQLYPTQPFDFRNLVLSSVNYIPQPATFFRRRVLEHIGYLDESLDYVMDFDYWLRAGKAHRFMYIQERLARLRIHSQAKSISELGKLAKELVLLYKKFFGSPDLPKPIKLLHRKAMSNMYYRAADCSFWAGQLGEARWYAWRSWLFNPIRMRRLWLYIYLGQFGRDMAMKKLHNPYLLG